MEHTQPSSHPDDHNLSTGSDAAEDLAARVLSRTGTALASTSGRSEYDDADAAGALEREARAGTRRVASLSTELEDVSEVEYRQVRLERVILVGLELPQVASAGGRISAHPAHPNGAQAPLGAPVTNGAAYTAVAQDAETSLRELAALAQTAGSEVLDALIQRRDHPDPATYLGSGKAKELAEIVADTGADTVIVDGELAPSQRRALEDVVGVKVVDRTALILDIFAQHAKSREGKAQVELAQLEYLLPRLRGWGESMSRQAGGRVAGGQGIGSRGPG
ncbi:GTPase HflX, partial [Actinomyces sp. MRS3W]|nr:GTPase HflX [Actinomyces sp. MRS3W]